MEFIGLPVARIPTNAIGRFIPPEGGKQDPNEMSIRISNARVRHLEFSRFTPESTAFDYTLHTLYRTSIFLVDSLH